MLIVSKWNYFSANASCSWHNMFALFSHRSPACVGTWPLVFWMKRSEIFDQKELPNNTWFKQIEKLLLTTYRLNVCRRGRETSGLTPAVVGPLHVHPYFSFETHTVLTSHRFSQNVINSLLLWLNCSCVDQWLMPYTVITASLVQICL